MSKVNSIDDIIDDFGERIKSLLLKNNNKLQTYEVDYLVDKMKSEINEVNINE